MSLGKGLHVAPGQLEGHALAGREKERDDGGAGEVGAEAWPVIHIRPNFRLLIPHFPPETPKICLFCFFLLRTDLWVFVRLVHELIPTYFLVEGVRPQQPVYFWVVIICTFPQPLEIFLRKAFFQGQDNQTDDRFEVSGLLAWYFETRLLEKEDAVVRTDLLGLLLNFYYFGVQ